MNSYIFGKRKYQVVATCVVAQLTTGSETYVYAKGLLPANTMQTQIDHLLNLGMIKEVTA